MRIAKGKTFYNKPWYDAYRSMMDRCYRPKAHNYPIYGGRGIKVCDEWHDIERFGEWAESSGFEKGLTIDRIDVNGNYEPSNCKWATRKEQANNRRNTLYITIDGETRTVSDWARVSGVNRSTINNRYYDGVRGKDLLRKAEDTKFKKGYTSRKHYAPTIIEAEGGT